MSASRPALCEYLLYLYNYWHFTAYLSSYVCRKYLVVVLAVSRHVLRNAVGPSLPLRISLIKNVRRADRPQLVALA